MERFHDRFILYHKRRSRVRGHVLILTICSEVMSPTMQCSAEFKPQLGRTWNVYVSTNMSEHL